MKKALIGLGVFVALLVVVLIAAPFFVPVETYKTQIEQAARQATGRELTLKGDLRLSLLPRLGVEAEDVTFANPPGASRAEMASLKALVVELRPWPLLSGEIKVDRFVLVEPVIHLEKGKDGRGNWSLVPEGADPTDTSGQAGGAPAIRQLSLGEVRLEDGLLTYSDAATGEVIEVSDVDMALSMPSLDQPAGAEGSLVWNGETLSITAESGNLRGLLAGEATPVQVALASEPVNLRYQGSLTQGKTLSAEGEVELDVPSVRNLAAWTGNPIALEGEGLGPLKVAGKVRVAGDSYAFTDARIALDAMTAQGDLTAQLGGAKPRLEGRLDVDQIDLNDYLPPAAEPEATAASSEQAAPAAAGQWSDAPIDLSALKLANVDFALSVGEIRARDVKIGRSALVAALKDGLLVVDLNELSLYGGQGSGRLSLDARGKVPAVQKSFKLDAVQAEPLLTDAAGFSKLEGVGQMEITVSSQGASQRAMVEALDGKGAVKFVDGAIKGINLAAMVRNLASAFAESAAGQAQKTDFAELSGSFAIENGVLRNDDLVLLNPLLRVGGAGTANIAQRTVNYRIEPKVVASLEGQGAGAEAKGIAVPVIVEGPWHDLSYRPDLAGAVSDIAKDPAKALQGAEDTVKQLKEGGGLGGLLGGGAKPPSEGGEAGSGAPKPVETLKKLFGN